MSDAAPEIVRFTGHAQALQELQGQLETSRGARERAALAGRLLAIAGDLGRRQKALPTSGVDTSLRQLKQEDVEGFLLSADVSRVKAELARAAEAALEAALAETPEERAEYVNWALEALAARDSLESTLTALEKWEALGNSLGAEGRRARERLLAELRALDGRQAATVRQLLGANAGRRAELARLDPEQRERAWWYSARLECDDFAAFLRDPTTASNHASHCEACKGDRERARLAERPANRHVTADELWDLDLGTLPGARRRWIEKHARSCGECAMALRALADGEEELPGLAPAPVPAAREAAPELVEARGEFKVLLFRDPRRARLVVEPVKSFRIAAARVDAPWARAPSAARAGNGALEFELGPAKALRGRKVTLTVDLVGASAVELELDL